MRMSRVAMFAVALLAVGLGVCLALSDTVAAKIQFPFRAGGQEFSAGNYQIEVMLPSNELVLRNEDTGAAVVLPTTTRLAQRDEEKGALVFDKAGEEYYLSEVYIPGIDGFELKGASGQHSHVKVKGGK